MEKESLLNYLYRFFDIIVLLFIVFDFGYDFEENYNSPHVIGLIFLTIGLLAFNTFKFLTFKYKSNKKVALVNMVLITGMLLASGIVAVLNLNFPFDYILQKVKPIFEGGLIFYFLLRLLVLVRHIYDIYFNPAIVFVGSFMILALTGGFLLMLPSATTNGITFTNALFTSASAVCVTGLTVVDTSSAFTIVGQSIILVLIQLGGIGILTFTSFFAFFFRGSSSFKEGLNTKDFIAHEGLKDVFRAALNVVIFTIGVEAVGAAFIYSSILDVTTIENKFFFSIFHSISAFCNAGFSILSAGLYDEAIRFDYFLQWIVMTLIVLGGLGHNIVFNFYQKIKTHVVELFDKTIIHKNGTNNSANDITYMPTSIQIPSTHDNFFICGFINSIKMEKKGGEMGCISIDTLSHNRKIIDFFLINNKPILVEKNTLLIHNYICKTLLPENIVIMN